MKLVLREDVEKLGRKGDLVDVADGYARNYLVPRGLALKATRGDRACGIERTAKRLARERRDREKERRGGAGAPHRARGEPRRGHPRKVDLEVGGPSPWENGHRAGRRRAHGR